MKNFGQKILVIVTTLFALNTFAQPALPGPYCTNCPPGTNILEGISYIPGLKLSILPLQGTNLFLNLLEADPAGKYDIYSASGLVSSAWSDIAQGTNGQTNFILTSLTSEAGFYKAARTDMPIIDAAGIAVSFPNNYINTNLITANVSGGPAAATAVLIDDTNLADAVWVPFSAVPYVLLGTTNGTYQISFGFYGSDGTDYWSTVFVTLDTVPPSIVITNPVSNIVSQPILQLQGYASEELSSIRYDLSNAAGLFPDQPTFVTEQFSDTNLWEFTTNWFQCFDVPLTNGVNLITLYATDLAGNTTTTNLSFTLDCSSKTNPPTVQLYWPQNKDQLSETNFILYGYVGDPTASVSAQIVDANNNTNILNGVVGRDGIFWVQNLPLNTTTNVLTLTVQDVVGNTITTNLALFQGSVALTINPISAGATSISGTIGSSGYTVWANGTNVVQPGDGTWHATIPAITGANGIVEATAIPNSDNDGNGSGSDFSGNPMSAQSENVSTLVGTKSGLHIKKYDYNLHREIPANLATGDWTVDWSDGAIGTEVNNTTNWSTGYPYLYSFYQWPGTSWPQGPSAFGSKISFNGSWQTNAYFGPPPLRFEYTKNLTETHNPFNIDYGSLGEKVKMSEQVDVLLSTGGGPGSTESKVWDISDNGFWIGNVEYWTGSNVPPQSVYINNFGQMDSSGNAYAVLPDNSTVDVTPTVQNLDWYAFNLQATKYTLTHQTECMATGNTNNARTTIGIGEAVDFSGMPGGTIWSVSGEGTISTTNGSGTTFIASQDPGSATVTATIDNATIQTPLNVIAPSSLNVISNYDYPQEDQNPNGTQMGAGTFYIDQIEPTTVSFYNAYFREEQTPNTTLTWPNGQTTTITFNEATNAWGVSCGMDTIQDEIRMPLVPTSYIYNGTNYVDFSFSVPSWHDQYRDQNGNWINFTTLTMSVQFRGSDKACRVIYCGIPGGWQGPY